MFENVEIILTWIACSGIVSAFIAPYITDFIKSSFTSSDSFKRSDDRMITDMYLPKDKI